MAKKGESEKKRSVSVNMKAGSLAYNRLDMQVSQTLHMAIELYPNLNYLLVLDHYDDITLFDNDTSPEFVSYYQMKTSEDAISIETAISEEWLAKLYEQLSNPEWLVEELGLITNTPLKVLVHTTDSNGKKHKEERNYTAEKTPFTIFNAIIVKKIKEDIAVRKGVSADDIDLSKFVHMRTTLSIPKHREIVEQEMSGFLQELYPRITVESAKTIFCAMMDLLTRRQSYELLEEHSLFSTVREKKGVTKNDFSRIIEESMFIAIPQFHEIERLIAYNEADKYKAAFEYTRMLTDFQSKSPSFTDVFLKTRKLVLENNKNVSESTNAYCKRIYNLLTTKNPIYNNTYISILIASVLINEWRRMQ